MLLPMTQREAIPTLFEAPDTLAEACRRFHVRRLDLFGSAATGQDFDPHHSDADFVVTFEPLDSRQYIDAYDGLVQTLEKLTRRPVDLLPEESIKNPYLRRRIDAERRLLFQAP